MIKKMIEYVWNIPTFLSLRHNRNEKRIILLMTPQYINFGDHAIAEAELRFFRDNFPEISTLEVSVNFCEYWMDYLKKTITSDDILVITGGGFMGDLWPFLQNMAENIITSFPQNTVVFFPQTFCFLERGEAFARFRSLLSDHDRLHVFTRDRKSYDLMTQELLPERPEVCTLVPDIVMYAREYHKRHNRTGAAFCLRDDEERVIPPEIRASCEAYLKQKNLSAKDIRMARLHMEMPVWCRSFFLNRKLNEYRTAQFVITDRLHGMLMSVITGTPCLVFDNISKKISGAHAWLGKDTTAILYDKNEDLAVQLDRLSVQQASTFKTYKEKFGTLKEVFGGLLN